jgi:hypothetical protein
VFEGRFADQYLVLKHGAKQWAGTSKLLKNEEGKQELNGKASSCQAFPKNAAGKEMFCENETSDAELYEP